MRIRAAALNPADLKVISGKDGGRFLHAARFPLVPGFDFSGVVDQIGPDVTSLAPGDAVLGFLPYARSNRQGTLAEYVSVDEAWVGKKPTGVTHASAAAVATVGSTALQALRDTARLESGRRVLVVGAAGGVGHLAVQIARHFGTEVWATCRENHVPLVRELGADRVVDYRTTPVPNIDASFDVVLDAACTTSFHACTPILTPRGVYVTLLPSFPFVLDALRALFSTRSNRFTVVRQRPEDLNALAAWIERADLRCVIRKSYPFDQAPEALLDLREGGAGKVVVTLS